MTILSSQKLKKAKYIWLQKGVKKAIRQDFLIRDLKLYLISLVLLSQNHFLRMDEHYGFHFFFNHMSAYFFGM